MWPTSPRRSQAQELARRFLAQQSPGRWALVCFVAARAAAVARALRLDGESLAAKASVHDIGYRQELSVTVFHPLDRARLLSSEGWDERVCSLVAYHSSAVDEAELRGLAEVLRAEFDTPEDVLSERAVVLRQDPRTEW